MLLVTLFYRLRRMRYRSCTIFQITKTRSPLILKIKKKQAKKKKKKNEKKEKTLTKENQVFQHAQIMKFII